MMNLRMQRSWGLLGATYLASIGLLGCGGPTADIAKATPPQAQTAAPSARTESVPTASASGAAPTAPPAAPGAPKSPFVAVAELPYAMRLFALDGVVLGVGEEPIIEDDTFRGLPMGVLDGDRFVDKPGLRLNSLWSFVVGAAGSWPRGVDLLVTGTNGRTGIAEHYVMTAEAGWSQRSARLSRYYVGLATVGESTVAIEAPSMPFGAGPELSTVRGPAIPRSFAKLDAACQRELSAKGMSQSLMPRSNLAVTAFGATAAGTLIAIGDSACGDNAVAEVWDPASPTSHSLPLDEPRRAGEDAFVVRGAGPDDAWLFYGGAYHYDHKTLEPSGALPGGGGVRGAAVGSDGTVYVITSATNAWNPESGKWAEAAPARLFRGEAGAWVEVPLGASPSGVVRDATGTVWLVVGRTLLRTRRTATETSIAVKTESPAPRAGRKLLQNIRPPGPLCPNNLVVLYGFTKITPDDYDFPATRKALKGHLELRGSRFVVARDGGEKFFSAIVPDVLVGRKLVALIEREVVGSKPQLVCAEPEVLRELRIDLGTGELQK